MEWCGRAVVDPPVEVRIMDNALRDMWSTVRFAAGVRIVHAMTETRRIPIHPAVDRFRIRVEKELVRIAQKAPGGIPRPFDPIAIALARSDVRKVAVPDISIDLLERDTRLLAVFIDEAKQHLLCDFGEQGEVGTRPVIVGTKRIGIARP
jgi:hypothetical protein